MSYLDKCAGCGIELTFVRELASSGIYNPNAHDFELCIPCWRAEIVLIDETGTNFQPTLLEKYYATFGAKRPKLYDVMKDAWV